MNLNQWIIRVQFRIPFQTTFQTTYKSYPKTIDFGRCHYRHRPCRRHRHHHCWYCCGFLFDCCLPPPLPLFTPPLPVPPWICHSPWPSLLLPCFGWLLHEYCFVHHRWGRSHGRWGLTETATPPTTDAPLTTSPSWATNHKSVIEGCWSGRGKSWLPITHSQIA